MDFGKRERRIKERKKNGGIQGWRSSDAINSVFIQTPCIDHATAIYKMMLRWTAQLVQLCKCSSKTNMGQSVSLLKSSRLFPSRQLRSCRLSFVDSRRTLSSPSRKTSQKVTNTALPHKKAAATNATSNTATIGEAPFPLRLFYTYRSKPVSLCQPASQTVP